MPDDTPSNTPAALLSGLSVKAEPGLGAFHRFGPLVSLVLLLGAYGLQLAGVMPNPDQLQAAEAILALLMGGWTARLGTAPASR